jgi:hypothetical protein
MDQIAVDRTGPKAFILAPDGEFSAFEPENDQIWALNLDASESCSFHLHTTYQLRARSMRVFPNILIGQRRLIEPGDFSRPPTVTQYAPSALQIEYSFINTLQVRLKVFIPEPDVLVGTLTVTNSGGEPIAANVEMGAILVPMDQGNPTHPDNIGGNHILSGQAEELYPVLFMSGGPTGTSNPHPALQIPLKLEHGQSEEVQWVLATKTSQIDSIKTARQWIAQSWHRAMQIHTKSYEKQMLFIKTGIPEWDAAFHLAQVNALTHLINLNPEIHQLTFIRTRLPDHPKYNWGEQTDLDLTLLDTLHLCQVLLPAHADHLTRLVEKSVARVDDQGMLRSQAQRWSNGGTINEPPLLANLCLMLYETNADPDFLNRVYPNLRRFFEAGWLKNTKQDQDWLPVWDTPTQLQLDTGLFNFDFWEETGNGLDIHTAESPAMAAMLYREAFALGKIAHILGERSARSQYAKWIDKFQQKMHSLWNEAQQMFSYQDVLTHQAPSRELYYPGRIQAELNIAKQFTQPQRLQIQLTSQNEHPAAPIIRLEGQNAAGERITELIQPPDLRWVINRAHITTRQLFSGLEAVHFEGFNPDDRFLIKTADFSQPDISCLLPVWSGGIHKDHLAAVLENFLNDQRPGKDFGIPETWRLDHPLPDDLHTPVNIQWNTLIIDGLAREGFSTESMQLFTNLMSSIIRGLKDFNGFYPLFDHETGVPIGAANTIAGLAPVGLFLKIAGIKLLNPDRVAIWGKNPFPWPVEVRWQGLWLQKKGAQTQILFPDGTHYHSQATKPRIVKSGKG